MCRPLCINVMVILFVIKKIVFINLISKIVCLYKYVPDEISYNETKKLNRRGNYRNKAAEFRNYVLTHFVSLVKIFLIFFHYCFNVTVLLQTRDEV